jgi:predicted metalloendopeptidase
MVLTCDDFYLAVNQEWLNNNPVPSDYSSWGSFSFLSNSTLLQLKDILDNDDQENQDWQKVKTLWSLGNQETLLNSQKIQDILGSYVKQINEIATPSQLVNFMFDTCVCATPFDIEVSADFEKSDVNALYVDCAGLGLPDIDMYLIPEMEGKTVAYKEYLSKLGDYMQLNFKSISALDIDGVYNLEKTLAQARMSRTDRRELKRIYNPHTLAQLKDLCGVINWEVQLTKLNLDINKINYIIVTEPKYFSLLDNLLNQHLNTWKDYLLLKLFKMAGIYTNDLLNKINFDFYGKTLSGQQEQKPRWKRVLGVVDGYVGEILGKKYVSKYFPESSKQLVLNMVNQMKDKLASRIKCLDWMEMETKIKALAKLDKMSTKIGYPDKWDDFSTLVLDHNPTTNNPMTYFECAVKCSQWLLNKNLQTYDKPVDKTKWHMTPHTINAYYNPTANEIVFPAAILQEPFFSPNLSLACNYGGIGAVICHEITHGFDDQGCHFDLDGNLSNWWTPDDKLKFDNASKKLEKQFDNFVVEDLKLNGKLTLGENIADLGGVMITLDCLKEHLYAYPELDYKQELKNFFTQWAIIWRNNMRPDEAKQRVLTDPHSPGKYRVNGILANIKEFYELFDIKPTDAMYLNEELRCQIW